MRKLTLNKFKTFMSIGIKEKFMFLEAFTLEGIMRMAILIIPFKKLKKYMGKHSVESSYEGDIEDYKIVKKVRWAVMHAAEYTPWESKCLVQALTVQNMLKRRKIYTTIYLGVGKDENNEMIAHSWIRYGRFFITGGDGTGFSTVAKFCNSK
ncbi:lasso peptide biosynthesis B2 protein [Clostridium tarantellae]|uniref:Lasso peptide biosynthesis B2 protein n=1 Tax=Clostridium tarantellae TaxID=39493 RepID=A0A6I1MXG1_9CLOT|nr:lasso peptide biosynthesis B2 protein [Clostridium tarantellae]MPQ44839.1 lasso peptide biosynthesis B2 protein [Clostridium tarantellae]